MAIFSSLWWAGTIAQWLDRWVIDNSFFVFWLLLIAAIAISGLKRTPRPVEVWVLVGTAAVYGMLFFRMILSPADRTHLFEYGLVAIFIYKALMERKQNGKRVPLPALIAILTTSVLGSIDEALQVFLPNRVFDPLDIAFNCFAALMSVLASLAVRWAHKYSDRARVRFRG